MLVSVLLMVVLFTCICWICLCLLWFLCTHWKLFLMWRYEAQIWKIMQPHGWRRWSSLIYLSEVFLFVKPIWLHIKKFCLYDPPYLLVFCNKFGLATFWSSSIWSFYFWFSYIQDEISKIVLFCTQVMLLWPWELFLMLLLGQSLGIFCGRQRSRELSRRIMENCRTKIHLNSAPCWLRIWTIALQFAMPGVWYIWAFACMTSVATTYLRQVPVISWFALNMSPKLFTCPSSFLASSFRHFL